MTARIYVASSWRNQRQPRVVTYLRECGHAVYDFRNPQVGYDNPVGSGRGFHWSEIDPAWQDWSPLEYVRSLEHPIARDGFASDWQAMQWADTCVLVLPSGRSAHLEAGYFVGAGKDLFILLDPSARTEPELMYRMARGVYLGLFDLGVALERQAQLNSQLSGTESKGVSRPSRGADGLQSQPLETQAAVGVDVPTREGVAGAGPAASRDAP